MQRYSLGLFLGLALAAGACDSSSSSSNQPPEAVKPTPTPGDGNSPANGNNSGGGGNPGDGSGSGGDDGDPGIPDTSGLGLVKGLKVDRSQYLANIGNGISGLTSDFRAASEKLESSARAYCASREGANLEALKGQYAETLMLWERLELFQIGPLAEKEKDLKTRIYGWPALANYCKIDDESMLAVLDGPDYELPTYANRKGLQALEYLIFESTLESSCPANATKRAWDKLDADQKWTARCAYMIPVTHELWENAGTMVSKWGSVDDNAIFRHLGDPVAEQAFLQELFNNLFYIDLQVKNEKIGEPAGQIPAVCQNAPNACFNEQEQPYSHLSKPALTANFRSLADVIFGFGQPRNGGLSALVRHEGGPDAALRSEAALTKLVNISESESASMDDLLVAKGSELCDASQNSWICQVHATIRSIIGDFKDEYSKVLKTTVPQAPQGDND